MDSQPFSDMKEVEQAPGDGKRPQDSSGTCPTGPRSEGLSGSEGRLPEEQTQESVGVEIPTSLPAEGEMQQTSKTTPNEESRSQEELVRVTAAQRSDAHALLRLRNVESVEQVNSSFLTMLMDCSSSEEFDLCIEKLFKNNDEIASQYVTALQTGTFAAMAKLNDSKTVKDLLFLMERFKWKMLADPNSVNQQKWNTLRAIHEKLEKRQKGMSILFKTKATKLLAKSFPSELGEFSKPTTTLATTEQQIKDFSHCACGNRCVGKGLRPAAQLGHHWCSGCKKPIHGICGKLDESQPMHSQNWCFNCIDGKRQEQPERSSISTAVTTTKQTQQQDTSAHESPPELTKRQQKRQKAKKKKTLAIQKSKTVVQELTVNEGKKKKALSGQKSKTVVQEVTVIEGDSAMVINEEKSNGENSDVEVENQDGMASSKDEEHAKQLSRRQKKRRFETLRKARRDEEENAKKPAPESSPRRSATADTESNCKRPPEPFSPKKPAAKPTAKPKTTGTKQVATTGNAAKKSSSRSTKPSWKTAKRNSASKTRTEARNTARKPSTLQQKKLSNVARMPTSEELLLRKTVIWW